MSAEFRLSDERVAELAAKIGHVNTGLARPIIERIVASEREAADRALVERIEAVLDYWAFPEGDSELVPVRRIRAALTRPDTEEADRG